VQSVSSRVYVFFALQYVGIAQFERNFSSSSSSSSS
jgi:hypothetical protein